MGYRKGDNGKYEFEQLPSGVHPHPECDRYFKVFNLSLIEGVPPLPVPDLAPNDDIEVGLLADDVIASSRCEVFEGSTDGAYYNFVNDKISVPSREAFNSNSSFLASLLHEMGHSTAPALDRQMTGDMRSKEYAHEEIVAELSSIFSSVDLAVKAETDPEAAGYGEHVAYLEFWKGLRKEGNFYIEDDPVDDGFGMIAAVELILLRNDWFRKYVKTLNCYWWNEETNSFDVEDGIEEAVRNWGSFHSGTYSSPTGIRKDAIPMHKLELILDEQRIIDDGLIRIDDVNNYLTKLIVETNGLRREGNFYIEENPEDGLGAITHIALCLSKQNWFRNYVKVLKCYRWNADTQDFDIEDAIQDMMLRVL